MNSDAADYSKFSDQLANRRRQAADNVAPAPTRSIIVGTSSNSSSTNKLALMQVILLCFVNPIKFDIFNNSIFPQLGLFVHLLKRKVIIFFSY